VIKTFKITQRKIALLFFFLFFMFGAFPVFAQEPLEFPEDDVVPPPIQEEFYKAEVIRVLGENYNELLGQNSIEQELIARVLDGPDAGKEYEIEFLIPEGVSGKARLNEGDKVVLVKQTSGEESNYYMSDVYRLPGLWLLLGLFFVCVIALTRFAGVRAIISLGISLSVIVYFLVPRLLSGGSILLVGLFTVFVLANASLFFSHGVNRRTIIAFISTISTVIFSYVLASLTISGMHLFGLGSEESFYLLNIAQDISVDLGVILILGIIIGVMGVLDDVTTAQAATIEELHKANPELGFAELTKRGFSVGREHILSLVNTLVLVYTGASLPLLLLSHVYQRPAWLMLNSELYIEEIVKILVASISLLLAVPITTVLAAWYFSKSSQK